MTAEGAVKAKSEGEEQKKIQVADEEGKESKKAKSKALTPGCARPVMIHRAMAGSIERFVAVLIEHFGGKWPFWLSPRQILVVPVGVGFYDYARKVQSIFHEQHMFVDVDLSGNTLQKKIRTGQLAQYNFIFGNIPPAIFYRKQRLTFAVVGDQEMRNGEVNIRNRDDTSTQDRGKPVPLKDAIEKLTTLRDERRSDNPFPGDETKAAQKGKA
jgi:threonyl-tRNA synthetase